MNLAKLIGGMLKLFDLELSVNTAYKASFGSRAEPAQVQLLRSK